VDYQPSPGQGGPLTLTTGRVLAHYNAGTMTRRTASERLVPGDALEIHPDDARARGIAEGDGVRVASTHGEARALAHVTDRVPSGVVFLSFHYPETATNAVTGPIRDRTTGCPEYKLTAVDVRREGSRDAAMGRATHDFTHPGAAAPGHEEAR
jgi:predicted molibdopterin-dependent oxidoreductase YjgC